MQGFYYLTETFKDTYGDNGWNSIWARFVGHGLQTALLGILTVFAVLSIIWGCLEIFKYVFYTLPEKRRNGSSEAPAPVVSSKAPAPETASEPVAPSNDGEIVAVIMAAIAAARANEASLLGTKPTGFRVVSFRKK